MKSVVTAALCGILAISLSFEANAAPSATQVRGLVQAVKQNRVANEALTKYLKLPVGASVAQLELAIGTLSATESAAILAKMQEFKVAAGDSSKAAVAANNFQKFMVSARATILANGQAVDDSLKRGDTVAQGQVCDPASEARALAAGISKINVADLEQGIRNGYGPVGCGSTKVSESSSLAVRENVAQQIICLNNANAKAARSKSEYLQISGGCLISSAVKGDDVGYAGQTLEEGIADADYVETNCQLWQRPAAIRAMVN